jgi:hypothetical protein
MHPLEIHMHKLITTSSPFYIKDIHFKYKKNNSLLNMTLFTSCFNNSMHANDFQTPHKKKIKL